MAEKKSLISGMAAAKKAQLATQNAQPKVVSGVRVPRAMSGVGKFVSGGKFASGGKLASGGKFASGGKLASGGKFASGGKLASGSKLAK